MDKVPIQGLAHFHKTYAGRDLPYDGLDLVVDLLYGLGILLPSRRGRRRRWGGVQDVLVVAPLFGDRRRCLAVLDLHVKLFKYDHAFCSEHFREIMPLENASTDTVLPSEVGSSSFFPNIISHLPPLERLAAVNAGHHDHETLDAVLGEPLAHLGHHLAQSLVYFPWDVREYKGDSNWAGHSHLLEVVQQALVGRGKDSQTILRLALECLRLVYPPLVSAADGVPG